MDAKCCKTTLMLKIHFLITTSQDFEFMYLKVESSSKFEFARILITETFR